MSPTRLGTLRPGDEFQMVPDRGQRVAGVVIALASDAVLVEVDRPVGEGAGRRGRERVQWSRWMMVELIDRDAA